MEAASPTYGPLKPDTYIPRLADARLEQLLRLFGAVEVRGTKWCGKSWCASAFAGSSIRLDDDSLRTLVTADPRLALEGQAPHVIDEWQSVPAVWDATRRAVDDAGGAKGLYILTGSSTPEKDKVFHSGAGRIAQLDLATMTLLERGKAYGGVPLKGLFSGEFPTGQHPHAGLRSLAEDVCVGGWPELVKARPSDAFMVIEQYLGALFEASVPRKGGTSQTARRLALALARNVGTAARLATLAEDAQLQNTDRKLAESTVRQYLNLFLDLYFIEELHGWDAPVRAKSRLRSKPKRYFADPSLPATLLGMSPERLVADAQTFGLLFESLCLHDIKVFASLLPGYHKDSLRYYADADGLEADIIIELTDGRWAAIEIKLDESKVPSGISNLKRLARKVTKNPAARNPEPEFMMVVTANSPVWRLDRDSGVYVAPLAALEP